MMTEAAIIGADIGGTNIRIGLLNPHAPVEKQVGPITVYQADTHVNLECAFEQFVADNNLRDQIELAAIAIAAPVPQGHVADEIPFTNGPWIYRPKEIAEILGVSSESILTYNDFHAAGAGITNLGPNDTVVLQPGTVSPLDRKAVVGPGTGLGTATIVPMDKDRFIIIPSEAQHGLYAARPPIGGLMIQEDSIIAMLDPYVSMEQLVSGPGLTRIYGALNQQKDVPPAEIVRMAQKEPEKNRYAVETIKLFNGMLGAVAQQIVLNGTAWGGVYLTGGVVEKLYQADLIYPDILLGRFNQNPVLGHKLLETPVHLVKENPAFRGLAALVRQSNALTPS
jgi:glucokinase